MWCEHCQTDVATEVSDDGQSLLCTTCRQPAKKIVAPSLHPETKSAREFLERWAREQQALKQQRSGDQTPAKPAETPAAPAFPITPAASQKAPEAKPPEQNLSDATPVRPSSDDSSAKGKTRWRVDNEHIAPGGHVPGRQDHTRRSQRLEKVTNEIENPPEAPASPVPTVPPAPVTPQAEAAPVRRIVRLDSRQNLAERPPHFDPAVNAPRKNAFPGRMESMWGQLMAYLGVGLLTVGTIFVLWGYFGDIERYASTGWLVATAGQMLLLLGIVTLVGGGMQQTTHEVSQRIEHLGGRIIRIEQSTDKILKGPYYRRARRKASKHRQREQDAA